MWAPPETPQPKRSRTSAVSIAVLLTAAALAVVAVPLVLLREDTQPQQTVTPGVIADAKEIRTVPQLDRTLKKALIAQLGDVLETLYERAFITEGLPEPTDDPRPVPSPATRVDSFFTGRARAALQSDPEVFSTVEALRVTSGRVAFAGIATLEGRRPLQALLEIDFQAVGQPRSLVGPEVRIRQKGTLLLVAMPEGWRVGSFDVDFSLRPVVSPTPEGP